MELYQATTQNEIETCYPAFQELRPHLSLQQFVDQVQRQMDDYDYIMVYLVSDDNVVVAAAGYRITECLAWGHTFYVDDLVTLSSARKQGYGGQLLDWLIEKAGEQNCDQFHLDSGVQRHAAHRLYLSRKLQISSHHFSLELAG